MTDITISTADLQWWWRVAETRTWTFATTYAATAPHHYIVEGRTPGVSHEDIARAARVIATFGKPGKYYSLTKIYLVSPDGRYRWWTEDRHFADATLVNRAPTDRLYGIQNATSTVSGVETPWDGVATTWDENHPIEDGEAKMLGKLLADARGKYPPHLLDLGCGTGRVLDLGLVAPDRYAGVDFSQAMLNVLLRKHPKAAALYPMDVRALLADGLFTPGQFDWVVLDAEVKLDADQRRQAGEIARLATIAVRGHTWTVRNVAKTPTST